MPADLHEHGLAGFECDEFGDVVFVFHEKLEREDKCRGTREQQKPTDEIGELHTFYSRVSGAVAVPVVQKNRAHHDPHNEHETPEDPQNVGGESYFSNGSKVEIHENRVPRLPLPHQRVVDHLSVEVDADDLHFHNVTKRVGFLCSFADQAVFLWFELKVIAAEIADTDETFGT